MLDATVEMTGLQLQREQRLTTAMLPVPVSGRDELLIRTAISTICTSDLSDLRSNPFSIPLPRVLGHEASGVVAAVGAEVAGFEVGDRVACHPVISCHACEECVRKMEHLCLRMGHLGHDRDGTFAEFFTIPAERARRIPEHLDFAHAALLEPVSVCLEAVRRARATAGQNVLVAGDGPFGVMIARLAKRAGARTIMAGMQPFRLGCARADLSIRVDEMEHPLKPIQDFTGGSGVDVAILAVDAQEALDLCISALKPRGRLAIFAVMPGRPRVDMLRLLVKELEIVGACNDENLIDESLGIIERDELGLDEIITHRVPFTDWQRAFDLAANHPDEALKVAMVFGRSQSE